jgi:predicted O-methyltransferase YrrM
MGAREAGRRDRATRPGRATASAPALMRGGRRGPLVAAALLALGGVLAAILLPHDTAVGVILGAAGVVVAFGLLAAVPTRAGARRVGSLAHAPSERAAVRRHEEAIEALQRESMLSFAQLEALLALRDLLALERPLRATRGAAASPDLLLELVRIVDRERPGLVLELGSGVSTVVIARRLAQLGHGRVISIDHEAVYADVTRAELELQGLSHVADVVVAPLGPVEAGGEQLRWYLVPEDAIDAPVDLLFVDGPPQRSGKLARYPALPAMRHLLAPGATIVVDDADRPSEQEAVRRWREQVPAMTVEHLPLEEGAFVLRMPG